MRGIHRIHDQLGALEGAVPVDGRVGRDDDDHVRPAEEAVQCSVLADDGLRVLECGDMGVMEPDLRASTSDPGDDVGGR